MQLTRRPTSERSDAREGMGLTAAWALGLVLLGRGRGSAGTPVVAAAESGGPGNGANIGTNSGVNRLNGVNGTNGLNGANIKPVNSAAAMNASVYISTSHSDNSRLGSGDGEGGSGAMGGLSDLRVEDRLCACFKVSDIDLAGFL